MEENFERIQQKTVVAQVMDRIKELIASGRYKVSEKIPTELELARMFGVGRSSVREALKIFQHLGVLESHVPKGTFVSSASNISQEAITWSILLGQNSLNEIMELRELLEREGVIALVAGDAGTVIDRLKAIVDAMGRAAADSRASDIVQCDYDFHAAIIEATGNSLFSSIYMTLHAFMQEEIGRTYQAIPDLSEIAADHREILESIASGDPERALTRHAEHFSRIGRLLASSDGTTNAPC